ncbi:hypothetical protein FQZ97_978120 [compost metagenome]
MPAEFLAELPARAQAQLAARAREPEGGARRSTGVALAEPLRAGDALEYVRTDRLTGNRTPVIYRVDRVSGDEVSFNAGSRIEKTNGQVVSIMSPAGGLFDTASPPGGWALRKDDIQPGMRWQLDYVTTTGDRLRHELTASVGGEQTMRVDGVELNVMRIGYEGWIFASSTTSLPLSGASTRFRGAAWYSPELGRVVRFEGEYQRGVSSGANESLELVRIQR